MATRVLLVDDSEDMRLLCRIVLESNGVYEICGEAAHGAAAIEAATSDRPDVVILDIEMPVMDGFEALPRLRDLHPDVPVIMLSADVTPQRREEALRLGAHALVAKDAAMAGLQHALHAIRAAAALTV